MMYVRGNPRNFDMWNALGSDGWSYADVLPDFKKSEDFDGGASEYHGAEGPLRIRVCPDDARQSQQFLMGATEIGYDGPMSDYNGGRQENGSWPLQFHIASNGTRASSSSAFLAPAAGRTNRRIELRPAVERLVFEGPPVVGLEYRQDGEVRRVGISREVIVSAGAFLSPKLLIQSGVGQNLQDHVQLPVVFQLNLRGPSGVLVSIGRGALLDWLRRLVGGDAQRSEEPAVVRGDFEATANRDGPGRRRHAGQRLRRLLTSDGKPDHGLERHLHLVAGLARLLAAGLHVWTAADSGRDGIGQFTGQAVDEVVHR